MTDSRRGGSDMTLSAEQRDVTQVSPRWFTLLAGPLVWTVYFLTVYTLGEFGCRGGWLRGTILGLPAPAVVVVILTLVALAVLGLATWRAYREWNASRSNGLGALSQAEDRNDFMVLAGWMLGALFTYLILLTGLSALVLPQCG
jgi:hypothetical protein